MGTGASGRGSQAVGGPGPLWLAVAGKGGSGKSAIAGTLARALAGRGHQVVAMDSDPMPGLARSLGMPEPGRAPLAAVAVQDESGRWGLQPGVGPVRAVARCAARGPDGVRLLVLGKADAAGLHQGAVNAFHRIARRMSEPSTTRRWTIVADLPAGPRHVAVGFAAYARAYLVVVEPTGQSVLTARRVARMAQEQAGVPVLMVANKVRDDESWDRLVNMLGETPYHRIPADPELAAAERAGAAPYDAVRGSRGVAAVELLAERLARRPP